MQRKRIEKYQKRFRQFLALYYLLLITMKQRSSVTQPKASVSSSNFYVVAPVREVNNILITMRKVVIEIIAALLVLLFLYASVSKLLGFSLFVDEMNNQPFPNWMTPFW